MKEELAKGLEPIETMLKSLNVSSVFGQPVKEGEATVIPVARVSYLFGAGSGYGQGMQQGAAEEGSQAVESGEAPASGEGGGSGGGGVGMARPVGYIHLDAEGARFEPIMDQTRISLYGITFVMWSVFWIAKTIRAFAR